MTHKAEITPITREQFEALPAVERGKPMNSELRAVRSLLPGQGVSFPCRWKHTPRSCCSGHVLFSSRRTGFLVVKRCVGGTFYVFRFEEET